MTTGGSVEWTWIACAAAGAITGGMVMADGIGVAMA